ncbi:Hypothetical predicted protein [Lynx pardinus]|uniref:Uncharacterized protein n=1 Tax=Lynx pardinus TaxID=191816 RepID=A0A485NB96_LYNPA|nr:Hypothetical predicted protein [Lynx pardinus]
MALRSPENALVQNTSLSELLWFNKADRQSGTYQSHPVRHLSSASSLLASVPMAVGMLERRSLNPCLCMKNIRVKQ